VNQRIPETYVWLLVPGQSDPKGSIEWAEIKLQGSDNLAARAAKKLKNEELLLVQLGGTRLRHELDRIPLWRGNHVGVKQLADDMPRYLYLPRLRDEDVLLAAIREGVEQLTWQSETFAYAEGWDETRQRYKGLKAGQTIRVLLDGRSLLVKPEIAASQLQADAAQRPTAAQPGANGGLIHQNTGPTGGIRPTGTATEAEPEPAPPQLRRFHASTHVDPLRLGRDAAKIAEEIVQHLTRISGAQVEITLEIQADLPEGASDKLVRDVTENCRTLKFDSFGFEES
jgi:hypothetical protein